ncbi:hydantoinase/oxoprolinase family protein [Nocardia jiangxiensis]|uniref:hydantoinase/oxoprolinase family protein n=1 Tax=Nocardia jiangxiensis TaxID=282685 RepID=UPI0002FFAD8F|nr:hydantoinase/oxoprolinase family protein [Nocardia jiangxiensis]
MESNETAFVGVDVGGTHTDAMVRSGDRFARGKAFTSYDDFARGVVEAIEVAGQDLGIELPELLSRTKLVVNGTTVVTNAITEMRGAVVGVIFTAGFKDTLRIGGGPRISDVDDHVQVNMPTIVDRRNLREVQGRIDYAGREVVPLDVGGVVAAATELVEERGVTAIAVCFMNSYAAPAHELAAEAAIAAKYPDLFITPSHRVGSKRGESARWTTAVLNCFVHEHAGVFLESLSGQLEKSGLRGKLAFFQGLGGAIDIEWAKKFPLALMGAGPAGGAIGAQRLAKELGEPRILLGDMGGTSFETGVLHDGSVHIETGARFGRFATSLNLVDVTSVGAGGGSIASVSDRGVPQVGPHSAGSTPGPAVYGKGGTEPTVTDAVVVMGMLDPGNYLGGRVQLRPDLAETAIEQQFGRHFGWTAEDAAAAIYDLVVVNMANAVREVSVEKGYDPREFLFVSYGGTLPLFAAEIAKSLDITRVLIPADSSVFSAQGLLNAEHKVRVERTVDWILADPSGRAHVNAVTEELVENALATMGTQGFDRESVTIERTADMRFAGQVSGLPMSLPDRPMEEADIPALADDFLAKYRETFGAGTEWKGVPPMLAEISVTAIARVDRPDGPAVGEGETVAAQPTPEGTRAVRLPGASGRTETPIYRDDRFGAGAAISGPAIIQAVDTTIYVPSGFSANRDAAQHIWLSKETK